MFSVMVLLGLFASEPNHAARDKLPNAHWLMSNAGLGFADRAKGEALIRAVRIGCPPRFIELCFGSPTIRKDWLNPTIWIYEQYGVAVKWKATAPVKLYLSDVHGGID